MKFTIAAVAAGAAFVAAQDISSLPQCGQTCINNMIDIASSQLGCKAGDVSCYCTMPDFGYGIRDCSNQHCQDPTDAQTVIKYGATYCENALSSYSATASATGSSSPSEASGSGVSSTPISTEALSATITTDGSTITTVTGSSTIYGPAGIVGGGASSTAITTEPLTGVITTDGSTLTTVTGSSTIYSAISGSETGSESVASSSESVASSESGASSSTGSAAAVTTTSSAVHTTTVASTTTTLPSQAFAAKTAVPILGAAVMAILAL